MATDGGQQVEGSGATGATGSKRLPTLSRAMWVLLATVALGVVPSVYYLIFVRGPAREGYLLQERLHDLGILSEQTVGAIRARMSALANSVNNMPAGGLGHLEDALPAVKGEDLKWLVEACPDGPIACLHVEPRAPASPQNQILFTEFGSGETSPTVKQNSQLYFLARGRDAKTVTYTGRVELDALATQFVGSSTLADYDLFVSDASGNVLFEYGQPGMRLQRLAAAATPSPTAGASSAKPTPIPTQQIDGFPPVVELTAGTLTRKISYAGEPHYLLTTPFKVPSRVAIVGARELDTTDWVFGVLVPEAKLERAALTVSYGSWSALPLLLLLIGLAVPMVKASSLGPVHRFTRFDLNLLGLSIALVSAVTIPVGFGYLAYLSLERQLNKDLEVVAGQIHGNFSAEIDAAESSLRKFIEGVAHEGTPRDYRLSNLLDESDLRSPELKVRKRDGAKALATVKQKLHPTLKEMLSAYPHFDFVLWANSDGKQLIKWSVDQDATPLINMRAKNVHPFFDDLVDGRAALTIHNQMSPLSGRAITVLSIRGPVDPKKSPPWKATGVASMVMSPLSLLKPILPAGYSFAVIESDGKVIYHQLDRRSLYENFYAETDAAEQLRSLVTAGRPGFVEGNYHGRTYQMFVRPLPKMPWTLVTYRDKEVPRAVDLDILLTWLVLLGAALAVCFAAAIVPRLAFGRGSSLWLWPDPRLASTYWVASGVAALWLLLGVDRLVSDADTGWRLALCVVGVPILLQTYAFVKLTRFRSGRHRVVRGVFAAAALVVGAGVFKYADPSFRAGLWFVVLGITAASAFYDPASRSETSAARGGYAAYVALVVLLLLTSVILPSLLLYRESYEAGMREFSRYHQLRLAQRLADRGLKVRKRYTKTRASWEDGVLITDRLGFKTKDRNRRQYDLAPGGLFWDPHAPHVAGRSWSAADTDVESLFGCSFPISTDATDARIADRVMGCLPVYHSESIQLRPMTYERSAWVKSDTRWRSWAEPDGPTVFELQDPRIEAASDGSRTLQVASAKTPSVLRELLAPAAAVQEDAVHEHAIQRIGFGALLLLFVGAILATILVFAHFVFGLGRPPWPSGPKEDVKAADWSSLSPDEKIVLYRLATTGFVAPAKRTWELVDHLVEVGWLQLTPEPTLSNQVSRAQILTAETEKMVRQFEAETPSSTWDVLRALGLAGALTVGVALYFTQREVVNQWSGALAALAGVAGSIGTVSGLFRARSSGSSK